LLHHVIGVYGLEDCVELVANATPAQLSYIFDLDLWNPSRPGFDDRFDAARFGVWLEVLVEAGAEVAAAKLAGMPLAQLVAGFAQHVIVFDVAAVSSYVTTDGSRIDYSRPVRDRVGCEIGGYHVAATREDAWDSVVAVLAALDADHPDRFVALMRAVRSRSHSRRERDFQPLLENREQMMFDVANDREQRRQQRGFASPADARAFLQMSRSVKPESLEGSNPIARAYSRAIEVAPVIDDASVATPEEECAITEWLAEAGIAPLHAPRALLESGNPETSESRLRRYMRIVFERNPVAYGERNFEMAYLANVLIAGCSIQSRAFTMQEASDGVVAICNLGLESLPGAREDYLLTHDVVGVFQIGWAALYERASLHAARILATTLGGMRLADDELQASINMLRVRLLREISNGTPWRASDALDVLTGIDMPAWAALVALLAECPVIHAGLRASLDSSVRSVDPNAFEFISGCDQLTLIGEFLRALPQILNARDAS
jgi:hypothetical protein